MIGTIPRPSNGRGVPCSFGRPRSFAETSVCRGLSMNRCTSVIIGSVPLPSALESERSVRSVRRNRFVHAVSASGRRLAVSPVTRCEDPREG